MPPTDNPKLVHLTRHVLSWWGISHVFSLCPTKLNYAYALPICVLLGGPRMKKAFSGVRRFLFSLVLVSSSLVAFAQTQDVLDALKQNAFNNPQDLEAWLDLGNAYVEGSNFDLAADSFQEAVALDYKSGEAHFGLGLAEYGRGDFPSALFEFSEVTRLFPDRFDGHFNRAVTLAKLLQFEEAIIAFESAIAEADPEAGEEKVLEAYLGLAGQYKRIENYTAAAESYASALELSAANQEIIFLRADALYRAGEGLEALADLSELEANSTDYKVSTLIADIYVQQEQSEYALRSLERALRRIGNSDQKAQASILVKLGVLQRELGQDAEAASSFQRAVSTDRNLWQAHYHLGLSYLESEQRPSAVSEFEQARGLNPDSSEVQLALASTYEQLGQFPQAIQAAQAVLNALDEEDELQAAPLHALIGRASYRLGDYSGALASFDKTLEADPRDASTQLWAGLAALQSENYGEAVSFLEAAVQLDDESVESKANLAAAYYREERYQDAAFVYQLMLDENPRDAEALYNLGLSMYAQGSYDESKELWQEAADLGYGAAQQALTEYF